MNEECRGCFIIRHTLYERFGEKKLTEEQIYCEHENLDCPCKTCLVKITCDILSEMSNCSYFIDFNIKHSHNEYWVNRRKE